MEDRTKFDHFTERSRRVIVLATKEAARRGQRVVYPEHLFLGLLQEANGIACKILVNLGLDLEETKASIELFFPRKRSRIAVSKVKQVSGATEGIFQLTLEEAHSLGHHYVGTEHLLLGLCKYPQGVLGLILQILKLDYETLKQEVDVILSQSMPKPREAQ